MRGLGACLVIFNARPPPEGYSILASVIMTRLTEEEALQYLKDAFSSHPVAANSVQAVRRQLGAYTATLANKLERSTSPGSENVSQMPLTGLRKDYIEAVRNHAIAKRQHETALAATLDRQPKEDKSQDASIESGLALHIELLRQQRRQERLNAIENFLASLESLDEDLRSRELERKRHEHPVPTTTVEHIGTGEANTVIRDSMTKLEYAVIQSDREAKQEREWLHSAQAEADPRHESDPARQFQALSAVRDELTQWLEQSLEKCAAAGDSDEEPQDAGSATRDSSDLLGAEYERYLKARQTLLMSAEGLQSPLVNSSPEKRPLEVHLPVSIPASLTDHALGVEASLAQRQLEDSLQHLKTYAHDELDKESKGSLEALLRLVDESQLLPEYPILAKDQRFSKVIGSLGSQPQEASDDKVVEQVEAWTFAAEAADKSLDAAVTSHFKKATQALDNVDEMLRDLRFLHDENG